MIEYLIGATLLVGMLRWLLRPVVVIHANDRGDEVAVRYPNRFRRLLGLED